MNEEARNGGFLKSALGALLKFIFEGRGDDPLSLLKEDYLKERALAARLRIHAGGMPYEAYSDSLIDLSTISDDGAEELAKWIQIMGSGLPEVPEPEPGEGNLWEKLAEDVKELNDLYYRYLTQAGADEGLNELMAALRRDKNRQSTTIQRLMSGLHGYSL